MGMTPAAKTCIARKWHELQTAVCNNCGQIALKTDDACQYCGSDDWNSEVKEPVYTSYYEE